MRTGADGFHDIGTGDCTGITLPLQLEFIGRDAALDIGGKHQRYIDPLRRVGGGGIPALPHQ
jgi:hypothetical protein